MLHKSITHVTAKFCFCLSTSKCLPELYMDVLALNFIYRSLLSVTLTCLNLPRLQMHLQAEGDGDASLMRAKRKSIDLESEQRPRRRALNFNASTKSDNSHSSPSLGNSQDMPPPLGKTEDGLNASSAGMPAIPAVCQVPLPFSFGLQSYPGQSHATRYLTAGVSGGFWEL